MARLNGDEDFDHLVVGELRRLGHDVLTVQDAGRGNRRIEDSEALAFTIGQGRAVLTFNWRHFICLLHQSRSDFSILVCRRDEDAGTLASRIHHALMSLPDFRHQ